MRPTDEEIIEALEVLSLIPMEHFDWGKRAPEFDRNPIMGWDGHNILVSDVKRARRIVAALKEG